jgi:hypothetical protein
MEVLMDDQEARRVAVSLIISFIQTGKVEINWNGIKDDNIANVPRCLN